MINNKQQGLRLAVYVCTKKKGKYSVSIIKYDYWCKYKKMEVYANTENDKKKNIDN